MGPWVEPLLEGVETPQALPPAQESLKEGALERFRSKMADLGPEMGEGLIRFLVLHVLDAQWKDHLLGMDELRRGIGLRAIGQKDPLLEYQFESYNLFQEMLERVREGVTEYVFRVSVAAPEGDPRGQPRHAVPEILAAGGLGQDRRPDPRQGESPKPVQKGARVGPNAPCPCGSGRKYKQCCGRLA